MDGDTDLSLNTGNNKEMYKKEVAKRLRETNWCSRRNWTSLESCKRFNPNRGADGCNTADKSALQRIVRGVSNPQRELSVLSELLDLLPSGKRKPAKSRTSRLRKS